MGEATAEAATRSTRGPIMAARAADSSTTALAATGVAGWTGYILSICI